MQGFTVNFNEHIACECSVTVKLFVASVVPGTSIAATIIQGYTVNFNERI